MQRRTFNIKLKTNNNNNNNNNKKIIIKKYNNNKINNLSFNNYRDQTEVLQREEQKYPKTVSLNW